jgi:hypothetical protein
LFIGQFGDLSEGDASRGGVEHAVHVGEVDGVRSEAVVEGVEGGGELVAVLFVGEEGEGGGARGGELVEGGGDLEGAGGGEGGTPAVFKGFEHGERVLAVAERDGDVPGVFTGGERDKDVERAGAIAEAAETGGGFVDEADEDGAGAVEGAEFGGKDVGVADGGAVGGAFGDVVAAEPVPPVLADDAAPDLFEVEFGALAEFGDGGDAGGGEAGEHAAADAGEVVELEGVEDVGEIVVLDQGEAIGFVHVGGDFGEEAIGGDADGAFEVFADVLGDGLFNFVGEGGGVVRIGLAGVEEAGHFINGGDVVDGDVRVDGFFDGVMDVDVLGGASFDDVDVGEPCFPDRGAGTEAELFGLLTDGDAGGVVVVERDDGDGFAAQLGAELLFAGCEEGVHVEEEHTQGHGGSSFIRATTFNTKARRTTKSPCVER